MLENSWLAIVLVIALVVVVNLSLWFMWRGRGLHDQINSLRRTGKTMRQPWQKEDTALKELSERVRELRASKGEGQAPVDKK
jgi:hypothetical protein